MIRILRVRLSGCSLFVEGRFLSSESIAFKLFLNNLDFKHNEETIDIKIIQVSNSFIKFLKHFKLIL